MYFGMEILDFGFDNWGFWIADFWIKSVLDVLP
jgi:hypothetical protein